MDFSIIFQLRTKKFWWMNVIFYFVISLLIASALCWVIFLIKNNVQRTEIQTKIEALKTVGTITQKEHEKEVIVYQGKINDFSKLLQNHGFASNVFKFMQNRTWPSIWFKQFSLDQKSATVRLSGEAYDLDVFSRQVAALEKSPYVKSVETLNSSAGNFARSEFSIVLTLNRNIFDYSSRLVIMSENQIAQNEPIEIEPEGEQVSGLEEGQEAETTSNLASEKLITSFRLLLSPPVIGQVDHTSHVISLEVPYGTNVKNLIPSLVISPKANVSPATLDPQDFTNPIVYTVIAEDGSIQDYTVKVSVAPEPQPPPKKSRVGLIFIIVMVIIAMALAAAIPFFKKIKARN